MLISILLVSGCITEGVLKAKFSNLPTWTMGQRGVFPLTVEGGTPPYACAVTQGALPPEFTLQNCEIDGTPPLLAGGTTQSISPQFTVTITDSANPLNTLAVEMAIIVKQPSLTLVTNPVACTVGVYCSANLIANVSGGTAPYHYQSDTFRNGTPPWGTVVGVDGLLIGIPTREGTYTFGVCAVDSVALSTCGPVTAKIEPAAEEGIVLELGTATCTAKRECNVDLVISASGGIEPYAFELGEGTLPSGTILDDGVLTGIPTQEGTYPFEVCAFDVTLASGCGQTTVTIEPPKGPELVLGTATCTVDEQCDVDLIMDVSGGTPPYEFELGGGTAPWGTSLGLDGFLTGIPTDEGTYDFEVCVFDSAEDSVCEQTTVTIEPPIEVETIYSGSFSVSGNYDRYFSGYTTCTFADDFTGTITLNLIEEAGGAVSGTADVQGTFTSNAIAGSTGSFECLSSQVTWSDSASVSGTTSNLEFSTSFTTAGGSVYTGDFIGSVYADSVSGDMEFTSPCCTGAASNSVTLTK
ncbi:MAG: hypothetical protein HYW05_04710 [Candidatus Diapherotrites archaeon]|nr:hypothetical protein [Candidatus Diapherotrites archaeon]